MATIFDKVRTAAVLLRDQHIGLEEIYRRFGPVCRLGGFTYLLGPDANKFVFAHSELFSWRRAFDVLVPIDGETAMIVSDGDDHHRRRRLVQPAFTKRRIDSYVDIMATHARSLVGSWRPGSEIDLYQEFRATIRRGTIRALFGERLAADEPVFGQQLQIALNLLEQSPLLLPIQKSLPSYRRAIQAREKVRSLVQAEVDERRASDEDAPDVLTALVNGRDDDGSGLSDGEITDQVISLIAAGYETTSAAMGWAARAVLVDPDVFKQAQDEVRSVVGDHDITADHVAALSYVDKIVSETLRLHPPGAIDMRTNIEPFSFEGHRIAAGTSIIISPYVTHRLAEIWPEPTRFDPSRWDGHKPAPYEYLPFGGGPHRCIGAMFATTELKTLLAEFVRKPRVELRPGPATPFGLASMRPKEGVRARVI